jgi:predicted phosphodiesterase
MAQKPLTDEQCRKVLDALKETGSKSKAARKLGLKRNTFIHQLTVASGRLGIEYSQVLLKPTYRVTAPTSDTREKIRICAIGDVHDSSGIPKDRLTWAGRFVSDIKHDFVVQIGDFMSLESVSRFARPGTLEHKEAPYWKDDMASGEAALKAFHRGLDGYEVEKHCTLGNHEDRHISNISKQPWAKDALMNTPHTLLEDWGWTYSPYGAFYFVGKTGFVHVPLNRMGKPFGGKFAENQIGNESTFDVVYGHSHRPLVKSFPKLNGVIVKVVNLGCYLPQGHVEPYAKHTLHGWEWGLFDITLIGGSISKANWIPIGELEEKYG